MMSGMLLETCWAFSKFWNNKFYYKVASCWLFLLIYNHSILLVLHFIYLFLIHAHWLCYVIMTLQYCYLFYIQMPCGKMMDQWNVYECMYVRVCTQDLSVDLPKYVTVPVFLNSALSFWKVCGHINEFGVEETKWGYVQHISNVAICMGNDLHINRRGSWWLADRASYYNLS